MPIGPRSLVPSLWDEYLIARGTMRNWRDLGTYNPASRLPSGKPSDHAVYPAYAFDVGGDPASMARLFQMMQGRPGVEYVIYNRQIWSRGKGIRAYTGDNPHTDHVHVSGTRISSQAQKDIAEKALREGGYSVGDLVRDAQKYGMVGLNPVQLSMKAVGTLDNIPGVNKIPGVGLVSGVADAVSAPADAIRWVGGNWDRILEVVGGFVLVLVGLFLLGRSVGLYGSYRGGVVGDVANHVQFGPEVTKARSETGTGRLRPKESFEPGYNTQGEEIPF